MNPLALGLLGLAPIPGAIVKTSRFPPVPHELFGMNLKGLGLADRRRLIAARLDGEVEFVRANGPMTTADLAECFGLIPEAMVKDLRALDAKHRVQRVANSKPILWEAA